MIRFALRCSRGHEFEGWFKSNAAYDEQHRAGRLECPLCGDRAVDKAIMAPAVARGGRGEGPSPEVVGKLLAMLRALRSYVEANFEHVGDRFPEEARKIHYGEAEPRDIYGEASREEVESLLEEGIEVRPLPWVPKLDG
ncbi:MAG: DUF1178 family protein [Geminicoccaceae bacterium]|nr:DUF1178 family protein [Geminicoccaceae bacterium]MCS7266439.1 DUF1178 family protein [Geminicoccaceae bacterium]MCX7630328.1 DUF1178 family protein [Geminicoccaceae bacterium]MDW8126041.1 DUF1178 family protein [Geminicoccaceae bacterium]MDW8342824.1 DUF1178 family protein [Geminicoccaceae bacterium]